MIKEVFGFVKNIGLIIVVALLAFTVIGFLFGGAKGLFIALINIAGLIYIISPIDLLPDIIPFAGWIDDLLVAFLLFFIDMWALGMVLARVIQLLPLAIIIIAVVGIAKYLGRKKDV